jgi:hypothetical protein
VAVRASREIVIDAAPEVILEALADVEAVPTWSSVHRRAHVVDRYDDGRPHHVKVTVKILVKHAKKTVLQAATEGLRAYIMGAVRPGA